MTKAIIKRVCVLFQEVKEGSSCPMTDAELAGVLVVLLKTEIFSIVKAGTRFLRNKEGTKTL